MNEHFSEKEFVCRCGTCGKGFQDINAISFGRLCTARMLAGVPFIILSSIRCKTQNHIAGGVDGSSHLTGQAFDIKATDSRTRFKIIEACLNAGFKRIGVNHGFIHVDDDQTKDQEVAWLY